MPVGLPHQVSSTHEQLRFAVARVATAWHEWIVYLELPSASVYKSSLHVAWHDTKAAVTSLSQLGYLTFRPITLLLCLVMRYLWTSIQVFGKHLFHGLYVSSRKGWLQLNWTSSHILRWQMSLAKSQVMMELATVGVLIGCYLLRRFIKRKQYVQRTASWYRRQKRAIQESYRRGVRRVAQTSQFLAMLMPHVVFLASICAVKLLVPRLLTYLARDTYLTMIVSFMIPMIWTIGLLHQYRNGGGNDDTKKRDNPSTRLKDEAQDKTPTRASFFPRTTPVRSVQRWLRAVTTPITNNREKDSYSVQEDATFWLQYWVVYALVLATFRFAFLLPIMGRLIVKYAGLSTLLRELQLVFFLWLFGVPLVTPELTHETRPVPLLYQRVIPIVHRMYSVLSTAIPESLWQKLVQKTSSILELAVFIKLISEETKEWLVHVLEESRELLPPALTLLMPGFITEYGVLYVKSIVPSAKCSSIQSLLEDNISWLEYWVLHGLLSSLLSWWAPLLWWIPFSSHATYFLWCNLQLPKTTRKWYNIFEEELQAFGLLEKGTKDYLQVDRTVTANILRTLASSLPSAAEDQAKAEPGDDGATSSEQQQQQQPDTAPAVKPERSKAKGDTMSRVVVDTDSGNIPMEIATFVAKKNTGRQRFSSNQQQQQQQQTMDSSEDNSSSSSQLSSGHDGMRRRSTRQRRRTLRTVN